MRLCRLTSVLCVLACAAIAQDLAPEVLLLARIKVHLGDEFAHLPNYTCLESISRFHKPASRNAKYYPVDTVRLEIAYSDHHEWYAPPGDRKFSVSNPAALAGGPGLIADGIFAITLHNLFIADGVVFTSRGADSVDGRVAVKFDYRFPARTKIANVSIFGGSGWVNEEGSIWADPHSLDLLRMDGRATEIPPFLPLGGMEYSVAFARTRIGDTEVLLAQDASLYMAQIDGNEDYDRIAFTHCRMYQTSSTLRFDTDPLEPPSAPSGTFRVALPAEPENTVPALLKVIIEVTSPISDKDSVGKLIAGQVVGDVLRKGKVVLENGAPVRGRIRRLDRDQGGRFVVGLEFTEVQAHGEPLRFYADLVSLEKGKGVQRVLREQVRLPNRPAVASEIKLPELPGVASFFVEGKTFVLPPGLRTVWRTRGLLRGVN